ncbi:hypothetical protein YC2023_002904 [Brassica napus]
MVCTDSSLISPQYEINFVRHEAIGSLKTSVDDVTLYFQHHPEFERLAMLQNVTPKPVRYISHFFIENFCFTLLFFFGVVAD